MTRHGALDPKSVLATDGGVVDWQPGRDIDVTLSHPAARFADDRRPAEEYVIYRLRIQTDAATALAAVARRDDPRVVGVFVRLLRDTAPPLGLFGIAPAGRLHAAERLSPSVRRAAWAADGARA